MFGVLAAGTWYLLHDRDEERRLVDAFASLAAEVLPGPHAGPAELGRALDGLAARFEVDVTVRSAAGDVLAAAGPPLEPAPRGEAGLSRRRGAVRIDLRLPDGRVVSVRRATGHRSGWLGALALLAVAVGVGAWPLARRLAGRLERLRARVDALGAGDLSTRVAVEGRDEVADLARSFNRAAERIERLVDGQRAMLAAASHELRSPLARLAMAVELLDRGERPELRARIDRDVAELDALIEELLLASRLEAGGRVGDLEDVDLLALAREEAEGRSAEVGGDPVVVRGERTLLRRLVRNLLDNAARHGGGEAISVRVERGEGGARITVDDAGPGVPPAERERVFEPFHRLAGTPEGEGGGVGLGLALVRRIARRHRGDARCEAAPGGGARFVVDLPARRPSAGAGSAVTG